MRAAAIACFFGLVLGVVACGGGDEDAGSTATDATEISLVPATQPTQSTVPAPTVEIPEEMPTELVVTELTTGSGKAAEEGDTLVVDYVGVRSEDGTEFDSSYGRQPYPVTLGQSAVIEGWQQGLVGAKSGARLQLDIPADLAYGDNPQGQVIQPGDALTFVIDVRVVVPPNDPANSPQEEDIATLDSPLTELVVTDDREGDGAAIEKGQTAFVNLVLARADNGVVLASTWSEPGPAQYPVVESASLDGLVEGIVGMKVGGRRTIKIPYERAFGTDGETTLGLPAETDVIVIVDLVAAY